MKQQAFSDSKPTHLSTPLGRLIGLRTARHAPKVDSDTAAPKRILLVASSGGHWVQMRRVTQGFSEEELYFASTDRGYAATVPGHKYYYVPDASSSSSPLRVVWQALVTLGLILRVRPDVVLSTGAAPGFFALMFAKKMGSKTIWLDSIANVDRMSLSGRKAAPYADLYLTQWAHLAEEGGPQYFGSVI